MVTLNRNQLISFTGIGWSLLPEFALYGDKADREAQETDVAGKPSSSALDFDELRIIALLSKHGDHLSKVTAKFPDFIDCLEKNMLSNEHIQDLEQFHKAMLLDEKLRNEYRSIK